MAATKDTARRGEATAAPAEVEIRNPTATQNYDEYEKENIGFDPYWTPSEGKWMAAVPFARDNADIKFNRFRFMAMEDTPCQRGPGDEDNDRHEKVMVPKGETFSTSVYAQLEKVLNEYLSFSSDTGVAVKLRITCTHWVKTEQQPKCWQFKVDIAKDSKKALTEWRAKKAPALSMLSAAAAAVRPQLQT